MRVVLDTNVLVSGILSPKGASRALADLAGQHQIDVVTSPVLLAEFERVLARFMDQAIAHEFRESFEALAIVVVPTTVPQVTRDPTDDHVVAAAVAGRAGCIVTRDKDLLVLHPLENIAVHEPLPALQMIRARLRD